MCSRELGSLGQGGQFGVKCVNVFRLFYQNWRAGESLRELSDDIYDRDPPQQQPGTCVTMNLEEKISGNEAAVEPELYFNELTDPSHRAQFEYLIKESKSYISHAVNVSELRLTELGEEGEVTTDQCPSLTNAGVSSFARVLNPE